MRQQDFQAFAQLLAGEVEIRNGKPLSEAAVLLWWKRLHTFELEQVNKAFDAHGRDAERGRFMPQPADIIRHIEGTTTDRAALAWGKVHEAMGAVGAYQDVLFDDPAIHAAVEDCGGWPAMCRTSVDELSYLQHRFCQAHRAYTGRGEFEYPRQLRGDRSSDAEYEKKGLPPPKPVLVGDPAACLRVLEGGRTGGKTAIAFNAADLLPKLGGPKR